MSELALRADCARCFGLCCVVPAFVASADFAISKPAGTPCPNLAPDFGCGIHAGLRAHGFPGCEVYDCFGAGQQVSQHTFRGRDWRADPPGGHPMFEVFPVMRALHESLWYLREALSWPAAGAVHPELARAAEETTVLAQGTPETLLGLDVTAHRRAVGASLIRASELVRAGAGPGTVTYAGADLIGAKLRGADLAAGSLRGALLLGADLRGADLRGADLLGADLRGADLAGADLTGALYLTQSQLTAAHGDGHTALSVSLHRPLHWSPGSG